MKVVSCTMSGLSPSIVRGVLALANAETGGKATVVEMPPAQIIAWENCALRVTAVLTKKTGDAAMPHPRTLGGVPIVERRDMPSSQIRFLDSNGEVLVQVEHLALPAECRWSNEYENAGNL